MRDSSGGGDQVNGRQVVGCRTSGNLCPIREVLGAPDPEHLPWGDQLPPEQLETADKGLL
jgi:hypothetical protein